MKLKNLLTPTELNEFNRLVNHATQISAGSVRMHLANRGLVVIGILGGGEVLTWFVSPARNAAEAELTEATVLAGVGAVAMAYSIELQSRVSGPEILASQAIRKAAQCPLH